MNRSEAIVGTHGRLAGSVLRGRRRVKRFRFGMPGQGNQGAIAQCPGVLSAVYQQRAIAGQFVQRPFFALGVFRHEAKFLDDLLHHAVRVAGHGRDERLGRYRPAVAGHGVVVAPSASHQFALDLEAPGSSACSGVAAASRVLSMISTPRFMSRFCA